MENQTLIIKKISSISRHTQSQLLLDKRWRIEEVHQNGGFFDFLHPFTLLFFVIRVNRHCFIIGQLPLSSYAFSLGFYDLGSSKMHALSNLGVCSKISSLFLEKRFLIND
jgi:hypothetical protein